MTRQMWTSGAEARAYEQAVLDNPRQSDEGAIAYMERIALIVGGLKQRLILPRGVDLHRGAQERLLPTPTLDRPGRVVGEDDMEGDPNQYQPATTGEEDR